MNSTIDNLESEKRFCMDPIRETFEKFDFTREDLSTGSGHIFAKRMNEHVTLTVHIDFMISMDFAICRLHSNHDGKICHTEMAEAVTAVYPDLTQMADVIQNYVNNGRPPSKHLVDQAFSQKIWLDELSNTLNDNFGGDT